MIEHKNDELRSRAALAGVDLDKAIGDSRSGSGTLFGDPSEYSNLSPEERGELTKKMKQKIQGGLLKGIR